ncbi:MAG: BirA family biotin operon repressor/biotin-[acetyl-CoA-carboxylase] ligase [Cyclobacteriaceae bacterium]
MHKFFAKTLFLGKKVYFLPECHSTNESVVDYHHQSGMKEGVVLWTDHQTAGRGQRGNGWQADPGKNLLASISLVPRWLAIQDQYLLNVFSALAIRECLQQYTDYPVMIKWPNDIYIKERKITGILVETSISSSHLELVILGFGVNVNQADFLLPRVTSLKLLGQDDVDREELLEDMILSIEKWYLKLKSSSVEELLKAYHLHLLGKDEKRTYQTYKTFEGINRGIDSRGRLLIERVGENNEIIAYDIKEITLRL